ncbi:CBS domain protein, partial [Trichuris suis]
LITPTGQRRERAGAWSKSNSKSSIASISVGPQVDHSGRALPLDFCFVGLCTAFVLGWNVSWQMFMGNGPSSAFLKSRAFSIPMTRKKELKALCWFLISGWLGISKYLTFIFCKNPLLLENKEQIYSQFIKSHRCYDLIPTSTKLVVFDTELSVKKAFFALVYNSVRAAPLWESKIQQFVGMLTITDFITILHKYYKSGEDDIKGLEEHRICSWREELGKSGKVQPLCTVDVTASLMDAVRLLCDRKVHRLPVVDVTTGNVLYILTHKRILRFLYLYMNDLPQPSFMSKSPKELGIGTWSNIHTVKKDTKLIEALRKFLELRVSALPVIDDDNRVVDIYAKFDVINLAADKAYNNLDVTVQEALKHRSAWFEGVHSCKVSDSMSVFIDTLVKCEVHRLVVTDDDNHVQGVVSLSDILAFIVLHPEAVTPSGRDTNAGIAEHDEAMEVVN